ncbi:hypothetical protein BJY17_000867 [Agromyces hippuratus]|uniref:Peptidase M11 gametolysin domain-containing protein n=1 Tax=Agromyces hippuratus TaxID=286438 RepID=A0A852WUZ9_9MICO|nr:hypothetical protein [Agromyces hippuratus]NYG20120.1 hypothetical protein [Agromyces hippuratus]
MTRITALTLPAATLVAALVLAPSSAAFSAPAAGSSAESSASNGVGLEVSGTLIVSVIEASPAVDDGDTVEPSKRSYSVRTRTGATVSVDGPELDLARTGDAFDGVVEVADEIVDEIGGRTESRVRERAADSAVELDTAEGAALLEVVDGSDEPLTVLEAEITPVAESSATEAARDHVIDIVVLNPTGVPALGGAYSNGALNEISATAARFWFDEAARAAGDGDIGSFTVSSTIVRTTSAKGCEQDLVEIWDTAAQQLGFVHANAYLDANTTTGPVRHLVTYLPPGCLNVEPIAVGTVGMSVDDGGLTMITLGTEYDTAFTAHELGHNFGLDHANMDFCTSDAVALGCTEYEYGDLYDIMGATVPGALTSLNSSTALALGWNDPATTMQLALAEGESTKTWSIDLTNLGGQGSPSAPRIIEIADPITGETYTVEHRHAYGDLAYYDSGFWASWDEAADDVVYYDNGVRLLRQTVGGGSSAFTVSSSKGAYNQSSAWYGDPEQDESIANPPRSVVVKVTGGDSGGVATIDVTLSRSSATAPATPVYRFWSDRFQAHFYTIDAAERDRVKKLWPGTWTYEGSRYSAYTTQQPGTVLERPLSRALLHGGCGGARSGDRDVAEHVVIRGCRVLRVSGRHD